MTQVETPFDQDAYNRLAIETAGKLHELRQSQVAKASDGPEPSLDRIFPPYNRVPLGLAREYERMGNQPVSDSLLASAEALGARFEHLGLTVGTVIHDIDLRCVLADATDERVDFIRSVLLERKVVFFRDQHLTEDEQVSFGRCFGTLDAFPFGPPGGNPYILEIQHGRRSPGTENGWHTDVTWMERPSLGSVAQMIVAPPVGGDTLFADSHAAFLGLPDETQRRIESLDAINDYRVFLSVRNRGLSDALIDEIKSTIPFGVAHPVARTHPETGKTALFLNGGFLRQESLHDRETGVELGPDESRALMAELLTQHARPEYQCRFSWEPGSIAFWDNRAVQHYASSDYWPNKRVLRRVTISGDRPYFDREQTSAPS